MIKRIVLTCVYAIGPLLGSADRASAQFSAPSAAQSQESAPAIPDDVRLILMIRNAVLALNQANITGNYTVLREMGTASFQMTNSSARLAEVFATLRSRKIDLSPTMLFNPKLASAPALQDSQVLRLTGFFPTNPEQVQFDLAFQRFGEQWMLAGIAVNVAPPGDGAQAAAEPGQGAPGRSSDAKAIRIDLSQPAAAKPAPAKKPVAAVKKPKPPAQKTAAAQAPGAAPAGEPAPAAPAPAPAPAPAEPAADAPAAKSTEFGAGWNPFGR